MHHVFSFYGRHRRWFLRLYLNLSKLTKVPLLGGLIRWTANTYAGHGHNGYYLTLNEAENIVDIAGSVALGPCSCRAEYHHCNYPVMSEIVLGSGSSVAYSEQEKDFHSISGEEAKTILRQAHEKRLALSIMRCGGHYYAICSCCNCCCVPTRLRQNYGIRMALDRNINVVRDFQRQQLQ